MECCHIIFVNYVQVILHVLFPILIYNLEFLVSSPLVDLFVCLFVCLFADC